MDESQLQDLIQQLESFVAGGPASEATLSKIAEKMGALKKQNDNTGAASKGLQQVAQGAEELDGSFDSLDRAANDVAKAFKKAKSDMLASGKTIGSGFKSLGGGVEGVTTAIKTMISGVFAVGGAIAGLIPFIGGGLSGAVKAAGEALGAGFSFLLGAATKTADAFNAVADTGATFGGSMLGMREAAHDAGQSFESFSKGFLENSAGLTRFAGSATAGAKALSGIQKAVSGNTGLQRSLQLMGVALKDQPAYLGEYLSMLAGSGVQLSNFNDNFTELAKRAVDYRKELIIARQLTGESNEEQKAKMRAIAKDAQFQAKLSTMGADAAEGLTKQMAALPTYMQPLFKDLVLFGDATKDSAGLAMTMPGAMEAMREAIANPTSGAAGINAAMESRAAQISQDVQDSAQAIIVSGHSSSEALKQSADAFVEARNYAQRLLGIDKIREDLANASEGIAGDKFTESVLKFQGDVRDLQVALETMVTELMKSPLFTTVVDTAGNMIGEFASKLQDAIKFMETVQDPRKMLSDAAKKIGEAFEAALRKVLPDWMVRGESDPLTPEQIETQTKNLQGPVEQLQSNIEEAQARVDANPNHRGNQDHLDRLTRKQQTNYETYKKLYALAVKNNSMTQEQADAELQKLFPTPVTPRAFGGPVSMNRPYLVGEQGPEIFSPPRSGTITPNLEIQMAAADGVSAAGKDSQTLETISTQLARHGQLLEQMIKVQSDGSQAATGYLKRISMN